MRKHDTIEKECKKHGLTTHIQEAGKYYRCRKCRTDHINKWRRQTKETLVAELGGKCKICGYDKCMTSLHFHHLDPTKKDFQISNKGSVSGINKLREEIKKCVLVCSNCHGEIHEGLVNL